MTGSALLVIDVQEGFRFKKYGFYTSMLEGLLPKIKVLISKCRQKGYLIIYLRYNLSGIKGLVNVAKREKEVFSMKKPVTICPEVRPEKGDIIIDKHTFSGFVKTDLRKILDKSKIKKLLFSGVSTDACIRSTLYDAYDLDYHCTIIEDCVGSEPGINKTMLELFKRHLDMAVFKKLKDL